MTIRSRLGLLRPSAALLAFSLLGVLACSSDGPPPVVDASSQRSLGSGEVVGFAHERGAHVWRGLPFAAPPVGELRWKAPRPEQPWEGTREALAFGPACPQLDRSGQPTGDEDCLTLNVYAPPFSPSSVPQEGERLPVMVFIHGGGNAIGSAEVYDGSRLAVENRVVVVAIQYRLGVFGWFANEALRADRNPKDASGNFATLDMVRSLEWVRDNIAAFGGDPGRVTIFGESAGGVNVYSLLLSPPARGLFHRAISESGFAVSFSMAQAENPTDAPDPGLDGSSSEVLLSLLQRDGQAASREQAKRVLAEMGSSKTSAYLHGKSVAEILGVFSESGGGGFGMYFAPFVFRDGHVILEEDPLVAMQRGAHNQVPVVVGTNRDEHKLFLAFSSPHVSHALGIPMRIRDPRRYDLVAEYGANLWKASGADEPATAMRGSQGPSVWGYRFDWDEEPQLLWIDLARLLGAGHAVEQLFVFGGTDSKLVQRLFIDDVDSAEELSRQMRSYWTQFAATGAPGRGQEGTLPEWTPWASAASEAKFMVFDSARDRGLRMSNETLTRSAVIGAVAGDERLLNAEERCEVYQSFVQWSDALTPEEYAEIEGGACSSYPLAARTPFE